MKKKVTLTPPPTIYIYYNILGFRILKDECLQNFDYFLDRIKINEKLKTIIFLRSEDIAIN